MNGWRMCALVVFAACSASDATDALPASRPNIVYVMADDLGYGDVESFGAERCQIDTPHFDRLAGEGMRFINAHANASVCVPTRTAVMTGRYPWRFGRPARGGPWGFLGTQFDPGQHTLATVLGRAGYTTGYVGKWHLGTLMATTDGKIQGPNNVDYKQPLTIGPIQYGFDASFILPGSLDMYPYAYVKNNEWVGQVTARKGWSAFNRVGPAATDFEDSEVLNTWAREAERFLRDQAGAAKDGKPFFLYVALTAPHTPTSPSKRFQGKSRLGVYGDFVMETDACLGHILGVLDDLELADETVVVATSDHGPASYAGRKLQATAGQLKELERDGHFSSGPFRGYKFSIYEGGLRVPYVIRWPGRIAAGSSCSQLIGLHDSLASFAELAGASLANDQGPDSVSHVSLWTKPNGPTVRPPMILESPQALALHDGRWKLALCPGSGCNGHWGNRPRRNDAWRAAVEKYGRSPKSHAELEQAPFVQLFDLESDPGESKNLAAEQPERVRDMIATMRKQIADGRSRPGSPVSNERKNVPLFRAVPKFVWAK